MHQVQVWYSCKSNKKTDLVSSVDLFISDLPKANAKLIFDLRNLILSVLPKGQEKLNYGIPFYYYHKWLCYLYVPAKRQDIVTLGFCQGAQLSNESGILSGDGKLVRLVEFDVNKEHDFEPVREVLNEAILLQDFLYGKNYRIH